MKKLDNVKNIFVAGVDPGFSFFFFGGGGAKDYVHAHSSRARSPKSLTAGVQEAFRVFDALSCYLSLILKHSDTKWDKTTQSIKF